eukprot:jgi/Picsp_1/3602/NSC_06439-R1_---NA---
MSDCCEANHGIMEFQEGDAPRNSLSTHPKGKTEESISPCTIELKERQYPVSGLSADGVGNGEKEGHGGGDDTGQSGSLAAAASSSNLRECLVCILRSNACSINSVKRSLYELKQAFPGLRIPERNSDLSNLLKQIAVFKAPGVYTLKDLPQPNVGPPLSTPAEREYSMCLNILEGKQLYRILRMAKRMKCSRDAILSEEDLNSACVEYDEKYPIFFRVHQLYRDSVTDISFGCKVIIDSKDAKVLEQLYFLLKEDLVKLKSQIEDFEAKTSKLNLV